MSLGVLIVGLGAIGMGYDFDLDTSQILTHARAAFLSTEYHLVGGVDEHVSRRDMFEQKYGCCAFLSLEDALKTTTPDMLVIAVPTEHHLDVLERTLRVFKPKIVLCEKPLSYCLVEAKAIVDRCKNNGIALYVNYMRRSDPGVIEIKRRFETGEIALPLKGVVWYSKGFLHNGSHFFNLLSYWLGSVIGTQVITPGTLQNKHDAEPHVLVNFEFGEIVFLSKPEKDYSHYTVELIAPNGRLRYEQAGREITWQPVKENEQFSGYRSISSDQEYIKNEMHCFQLNVFKQIALSQEGKPAYLSTGDDALKTLKLLMSILNIGKS